MAKEKTTNTISEEKAPAAYFASLALTDVKCFQGLNNINLSNKNGNFAKWTVILGNNNTGKTTILKCLALLEAVVNESDKTSYSTSNLSRKSFFKKSIINRTKVLSKILLMNKNNIRVLDSWGFWSVGYFEEETTNRKTPLFAELILKNEVENLKIISYGISRKMESSPIANYTETEENKHANLFENKELPNIEDWLLGLFLSEKLGQTKAKKQLDIAKKILISGLLPDVYDIEIKSEEVNNTFKNFVVFKTDFGWIRLGDLGFGYQSMVAWVMDLVRRMVERYPNSTNPLAEPAIVLVDEIDLHLHPDWQRKIVAHLSKYFPKTQFIVTAHSPLIVQSADEVNLVLLKKDPISHNVSIEQPNISNFKGWTVEEILTDLMDLEGQTMSNTYLGLMQQFEEGLDTDDFEKTNLAFQELNKILHPESKQRKLLSIQMTNLSAELVL